MKKRTPVLLTIGLLTLAALSSVRAADSPAVGDWSGVLKVGGSQLSLIFHIKEDAGKLSMRFDSPDQGTFGLPVDSVAFEKGTLTLENRRLNAKYVGKLNEAKTEVVGEWSQAGMTNPLTLTKGDPAKLAPPDVPKLLSGSWEGPIDLGAMKLRVLLQVKFLPDGTVVLGFDSPEQGSNGIPVNTLSLKDNVLKFEVNIIKGSYEGTLDPKALTIQGKWSQGGASVPLDLKHVDKPTEAKRPQMPKGPFPYRSEDVTYRNEPADVTLAGTLTLPKGEGPFPGVLLITGSGPQDRDETLMGHKPFLVLADSLSRRGVAVLRVDDRGVGKSTGSMAKATSDDFAGDVLSGVNYLKTRKEIDPKRIGLIGHSEGGMIAPMVAVKSPDVAFIVLMAGTGIDGEKIMYAQSYLMAKAAGRSRGRP